MSDGTKDDAGSSDKAPRDIGGSQLLGRGLNRLDWAEESKECQKVGDTESGKRPVPYKNTVYNVGKHVTMTTVTKENYFTETFLSRDEYEKHTQSSVEVSGSYGAFSGGFKATFGTDIKKLEEREAAIYNHTVRLWKLTFEVNPANSTDAFKERVKELPLNFDPAHPKAFFNFFVEFGADIVNEVVVGGALNYAMTALKTYLNEKNTLDAMVKAEYGTFISATASTSISEEIKKHLAHRSVSLTTQGGTHSINFNAGAPNNCNADFMAWRESLPDDPKVVELKLVPIYLFVKEGETRTALEAAYQWYTSYKTEIEANWKESMIIVGRSSLPTTVSTAAKGPALRMVFVDSNSKSTSESYHYPPQADAAQETFDQFWDALALLLKQKTGYKLLMATERWPRDKKHYPSPSMREALRQNGASERALQRWESLTQKSQPNPIAGLTYVLAGNDFEFPGVDGLIVGFGQPGKDLNPTVKVVARLAHDSFGRVKVVQTGKTLEDPKTVLYIVRNNTGANPALAMDPQHQDRVAMQTPDTQNPGQFWYMPELEKPYPEINHPVLLINYQTGTCLQGMLDQGDCRLTPMGPGRQQDDVIWDRRGDHVFHLLMVYYHHHHLNLTQVEKRAAVRPWREPHGMDWFREAHVPFS
ncbi:MAC/perforin domain-containing protein [Pseudomonas sp. MWU13-2105]|uniref:MAC/perforin domain-containing protein n=1 Tax=Pseudomonas sp. MWU13-2105 TaxID=2935074 RepID=UPI00200CD38D|nr:MAC/perforin domain-containing protein [Pseudomonas sp. MWU13-2105]